MWINNTSIRESNVVRKILSDIKIIDGIEHKKCLSQYHIGEKYVPLSKMCKRKGRKIPYGSNCLVCFNIYNKLSRNTEDKRKVANALSSEYIKARRLQNGMGWSIWHSAKNRAKRNNIIFTITPEDVIVPDVCPVLNIPLITDPSYLLKNKINGQLNVPNYPSIDRIVPELGYSKSNIVVISRRANNLKRDASLQELEAVVHWLKQQ